MSEIVEFPRRHGAGIVELMAREKRLQDQRRVEVGPMLPVEHFLDARRYSDPWVHPASPAARQRTADPLPVFRSRRASVQPDPVPDMTPEQVAILSLLDRIEALERRLAQVEGRA
jgi:hypothetical protein